MSRGIKFFVLRAVPYGMENTISIEFCFFEYIYIYIFITHVRKMGAMHIKGTIEYILFDPVIFLAGLQVILLCSLYQDSCQNIKDVSVT